jgi:hypothetical protein
MVLGNRFRRTEVIRYAAPQVQPSHTNSQRRRKN